jgi:uncharacterized protein (TIGR03067 family)
VLVGDHTRVTFGSTVILDATTRLDRSVVPWRIDYRLREGPDAGRLQPALARFDGAELELCMGRPGAARPTDFTPGPEVTWSRWRR